MSTSKIQISSEKKLTLLLLCWLFGLFAIHRFYTGKYRAGGVQLLIIALAGLSAVFKAKSDPILGIFSAIGILTLVVWWVVDMARIIMGKYTDKEGRPIVDWV